MRRYTLIINAASAPVASFETFQRNPQSPYRELNPDHLFGRQMCCPLHHTDEIELMGVEPMTFCGWNSCSPAELQLYTDNSL